MTKSSRMAFLKNTLAAHLKRGVSCGVYKAITASIDRHLYEGFAP